MPMIYYHVTPDSMEGLTTLSNDGLCFWCRRCSMCRWFDTLCATPAVFGCVPFDERSRMKVAPVSVVPVPFYS